MRNATDAIVTGQHFARTGDEARMSAVVRLDGLMQAPLWEVGLTMVIEEMSGAKALWALAHPEGAPDFHARDCFVARSEEHTSELQSLMRISYAVFCLKKK